MVTMCELLCPIRCIPLIIKNSIKANKLFPQHYETSRSTAQNYILSKLKHAINVGKSLEREDKINNLDASENEVLPATPTTLKLKNAIRVLGYVGNKQIIPAAQQRQASVSLPFDVVAIEAHAENETKLSKYGQQCP